MSKIRKAMSEIREAISEHARKPQFSTFPTLRHKWWGITPSAIFNDKNKK